VDSSFCEQQLCSDEHSSELPALSITAALEAKDSVRWHSPDRLIAQQAMQVNPQAHNASEMMTRQLTLLVRFLENLRNLTLLAFT
jgi:hypothetical protein